MWWDPIWSYTCHWPAPTFFFVCVFARERPHRDSKDLRETNSWNTKTYILSSTSIPPTALSVWLCYVVAIWIKIKYILHIVDASSPVDVSMQILHISFTHCVPWKIHFALFFFIFFSLGYKYIVSHTPFHISYVQFHGVSCLFFNHSAIRLIFFTHCCLFDLPMRVRPCHSFLASTYFNLTFITWFSILICQPTKTKTLCPCRVY